jgi:hypothetical protein
MSSPEVSDHVDDASPEVSEHEESSPVAPAKEEASVASTTIDGFCNVKQDAKFGYRRPRRTVRNTSQGVA